MQIHGKHSGNTWQDSCPFTSWKTLIPVRLFPCNLWKCQIMPPFRWEEKRPWELLHQHLLTSQSNCNVYIAIKEQNQHVPVDKLDLADSDVWWTSAHPSTPDRGTWNSHNSRIQSAKKGYKRSDGFLCPTMSKWQQTWGGKCTGNGWCIWFIWIRCANVAPKPLAN